MNYQSKLYSLTLVAALSNCVAQPEPATVPTADFEIVSEAPEMVHNDHLPQYSREMLEELYKYSVIVKSFGALKTPEETFLAAPLGTGLSLDHDYVLTAAHLILPPVGEYPQGTVIRSELKVEEYAATILKQDFQKDLALLKVEDCFGCLAYFKGQLAKKVEISDVIAGVGFKLGDKGLFLGYISGESNEPLKITLLNTSISSGDSGSSVFVFEEGKPYLAGVMRAAKVNPEIGYTGTAGMTPLEDLREFLTGVEGLEEYLGTEVKHEKH